MPPYCQSIKIKTNSTDRINEMGIGLTDIIGFILRRPTTWSVDHYEDSGRRRIFFAGHVFVFYLL
jgi:hypothetical protein